MGIPAYFAQLIRQFPHMLRPVPTTGSVDHVGLDSNSLVYEAFYAGQQEAAWDADTPHADVERRLIGRVLDRLDALLRQWNPQRTVWIALDGVAPVAKMNQQRRRRFQSVWEAEWARGSATPSDDGTTPSDGRTTWSPVMITPGTPFMRDLNAALRAHFHASMDRWGTSSMCRAAIWVSGSDVPGEGEHKLFAHWRTREASHRMDSTWVYGLDADLIMLSLGHLPWLPGLSLVREAPSFGEESSDPHALWQLNIAGLATAVTRSLDPSASGATPSRVRDYLLLCFLLGNDFLPHFPALSLRRRGLDRLLAAFRAVGAPSLTVASSPLHPSRIEWGALRRVVRHLAAREDTDWKEEALHRVHLASRVQWTTRKERLDVWPVTHRETEDYIAPGSAGWRSRYYEALFSAEAPGAPLPDRVASTYVDGLDWTWQYYWEGCPDWRWHYPHKYPPLLQDLVRALPTDRSRRIGRATSRPVDPEVQLICVLPSSALARGWTEEGSRAAHREWPHHFPPPRSVPFQWAYCRFWWEAQPCLPAWDVEAVHAWWHARQDAS
jgi:5'-3' exonuclease